MKLISCYVENFGKLNKFTHDFEEGLNIKEEENGWGKSTLAAFIKAMFYGLEYSRGKKLTDRKLYSPWNENKFGGNIVFKIDETVYKIERFFGKTTKTDTVEVYNMSRNTLTDELGDNPGETIWKVDRDSYEKTAFITLDDSSLLNDIISSKLGNIEEQEADIETSSQAVDLLDKEMTRIKARRGNGGLIGDKEKSRINLQAELRENKNSLIRLNDTEKSIMEKEKQLEVVTDQINKIDEEQSKQVLYEKKRQYSSLLEDLEIKEKVYDEDKGFFKDRLLSGEDLNEIKNQANNHLNIKDRAVKIKLSDGEAEQLDNLKLKFKDDIPSLSDIELYSKKINDLSNKRIEIEKYVMSGKDQEQFMKLEERYKGLDISTIDQYLKDLSKVSELIEEENKIKNTVETLKQERITNKESKSKANPDFIKGLIITLLGLISIPILSIIGVIVALSGAVILIKSFKSSSKDKAENINADIDLEIENLLKKLNEVKARRENLENGYISFIESINESPTNIASFLADSKLGISEYNRLKQSIDENVLEKEKLTNDINNLKNEISLYLNKYYLDIGEVDYNKSLSKLRDDLSSYKNFLKVEDEYNKLVGESEELENSLRKNLLYYYDFISDINGVIKHLEDKYQSLQISKGKFKDAEETRDKFRLKNNIELLENLNLDDKDNQSAAENLIEDKRELTSISNDLIKQIERDKKDRDILTQEADRIEDIESEILKVEEDLTELNKKHELLLLTKECMIEAKENLAEKYIGDMSSSFKKNLSKLNNGQTKEYSIDINLKVKVEDGGKFYSKDQLSSGMKDLVQLCLRMSLVESVYKDVYNPVLVLDDPFINLDNNRLVNSMELLKEISERYQVIYFVCHSSRNIK